MGSSPAVAAVTNVINKFDIKPKAPPAAPAMVDAPPEATAAADRVRKKNVAAYGRNDTILTGPQGTLGMMTTGATTAPKTILGG